MSEFEKQRRLLYKLNRQKWIKVQIIILSGLMLLTLISSGIFCQYNKAYYINYVEDSDIDYKVLLKENEFYNSPYAEEGKAYVGSLIDKVIADFKYELYMDAEQVNFEYSYKIDAILQVKDSTGAIIYDKTDVIVPEQQIQKTGDQLMIDQHVEVDYSTYNKLAERFVEVYDLNNTKSVLVLKMHMNVIGACEEFSDDNSNAYTVSLNVPLSSKTVNMTISSSVEEGDNQILARENERLKNLFFVSTVILFCLLAIDALILVLFVYITRNHDINYEIQLKRIINNYKSFIQRINNPLEISEYQPLFVNTFGEMLEIRDTIQSPILAYENEDKTLTQFLIPTNTKILYIFEVKVGDYDEIYKESTPAEELPTIEDPVLNIEDIDYIDEIDESYEESKDAPGVEVIGVVWPEKPHGNKIYRYDPNGETVEYGDQVLVPSKDKASNKDIIRQAAVAHGNHLVDPQTLKYPLKKIIKVVKRKAEDLLSVKK